ncbi:hypothetical protein [Streptomyces sp. NPDC048508]|uniref:hypothetical protein n=1 Tax=Streptomyces sp. NPDC048508 TaxID=3365561 RepID=UPI00370FC041
MRTPASFAVTITRGRFGGDLVVATAVGLRARALGTAKCVVIAHPEGTYKSAPDKRR